MRIERFSRLATRLLTAGLPAIEASSSNDISVFAFYESYFSNYIEGTARRLSAHPFADGNGRTARLLMNSELTAAGQGRIIITTRRRGDYLAALRGMTNVLNVDAFVTILASLQRETAAVDFASLDSAQAQLTAEAAFSDPDLDAPALDGLLDVANARDA